jgi:hypothetical protein
MRIELVGLNAVMDPNTVGVFFLLAVCASYQSFSHQLYVLHFYNLVIALPDHLRASCRAWFNIVVSIYMQSLIMLTMLKKDLLIGMPWYGDNSHW